MNVDIIITISLILITVLMVCVKFIMHIYNIKLIKTVTSLHRGTKSEQKLILQLLKLGIHYNAIFHDLYLQRREGKFTQIDLVVPTKVGIIVFEVKDYSGWIFGNGFDKKWTQVLAYGKQKYTFYNPIIQNNSHIKELKKYSCFNNIPFYSVIVFDGDCELRDISLIPDGSFVTKSHRTIDVVNNILHNNKLVHYSNKNKIIDTLKQAVKNGDNESAKNVHIENIQDLIGGHRVFK